MGTVEKGKKDGAGDKRADRKKHFTARDFLCKVPFIYFGNLLTEFVDLVSDVLSSLHFAEAGRDRYYIIFLINITLEHLNACAMPKQKQWQ